MGIRLSSLGLSMSSIGFESMIPEEKACLKKVRKEDRRRTIVRFEVRFLLR